MFLSIHFLKNGPSIFHNRNFSLRNFALRYKKCRSSEGELLSVSLSSTICVLLYIFRNISYIFANLSLYKMTQCLQKMEHFSAISLKNVSFAAVIE